MTEFQKQYPPDNLLRSYLVPRPSPDTNEELLVYIFELEKALKLYDSQQHRLLEWKQDDNHSVR